MKASTVTTFLLTSKATLKGFVHQEDRDYFSRPVRVVVNHRDEIGLVHVTDPMRGHSYPVKAMDLVPAWALTRRQAIAAGLNSWKA